MSVYRHLALGAMALTMLMGIGGSASAGADAASLWINNPNPDDAGIVPAGPADATFNPGPINYDSRVTDYTIGGFLNHPTFSNESAAFTTAGGGAATANNLFLLITGTIGLASGNNSFVVSHDDGAVLDIAGFGKVLDVPGPSAPANSPFNVFNPGAAGNFDFTLNYTECCGPPAVLLFQVNNVTIGGVPEAATWAMMLLGVGMVGGGMRMARRKDHAAVAAL